MSILVCTFLTCTNGTTGFLILCLHSHHSMGIGSMDHLITSSVHPPAAHTMNTADCAVFIYNCFLISYIFMS